MFRSVIIFLVYLLFTYFENLFVIRGLEVLSQNLSQVREGNDDDDDDDNNNKANENRD